MTKKKVKVARTIKINAYEFVAQAVARGVNYGCNRVEKYSETTKISDDERTRIYDAVMSDLCEILDFSVE
jgi:hypothetical protein